MRRVIVLAVVCSACGGLLPFGEDEAPPAPTNDVDASASGDASAAEGGTDPDAATVDAAPDGPVWRCTAVIGNADTYANEQTCIGARYSAQCDVSNPLPDGQPCLSGDPTEPYCPPCTQDVGSLQWSFTKWFCACEGQ